MSNQRLDAALAYRPQTALCPRCNTRKPFAEMTKNNSICKQCWADYSYARNVRRYRHRRRQAGQRMPMAYRAQDTIYYWRIHLDLLEQRHRFTRYLGPAFTTEQRTLFTALWEKSHERGLSYLYDLVRARARHIRARLKRSQQ